MGYDEGALFALMALWGAFAFIFFIVGIVMYVLAAIGLQKLATNQGIENAWLAWIPIGNLYILGKLIKELAIGSLEVPRIELVLPIGCLAVGILGSIPVIGWLVNVAYVILVIFAVYKLFKIYRPDQATLWLILSIVLPFMGPVFLFVMRNDTPEVY